MGVKSSVLVAHIVLLTSSWKQSLMNIYSSKATIVCSFDSKSFLRESVVSVLWTNKSCSGPWIKTWCFSHCLPNCRFKRAARWTSTLCHSNTEHPKEAFRPYWRVLPAGKTLTICVCACKWLKWMYLLKLLSEQVCLEVLYRATVIQTRKNSDHEEIQDFTPVTQIYGK